MKFLLSLANSSLIQIFVFGSFFTGLYYFSFYDDGKALRKEIERVKTQAQSAQTNIEETKIEIDNVLSFKKVVEKDEEFVKVFLNYTPDSLTFNEISTLVNNEASDSGVNIQSKRDVSINDVTDRDYQTLHLEIELVSSFSQLMFFLSKLTMQRRILIIESIDVKIDQGEGFVLTQIKLLAYRYKKPEEQQEENSQEA